MQWQVSLCESEASPVYKMSHNQSYAVRLCLCVWGSVRAEEQSRALAHCSVAMGSELELSAGMGNTSEFGVHGKND